MPLSKPAIEEICKIYKLNRDDLTPLNAYYSHVFEFQKEGIKRILKVKGQSDTNFDFLNSEILWLNYLKENDFSVSYPLRSETGNYIDSIEISEEESYYVLSYIKADGEIPRKTFQGRNRYPQNFLNQWGKYVGRLHKLSSQFSIPSNFKRPRWQDTVDFFDLETPPPSQAGIVLQYKKTTKEIGSFQINTNNYGMIHNDLLEDNMFINGDSITAFDFEDCCFNWFANDIAIPFFYPVCFSIAEKEKQRDYGRYFLEHFLKGYREERDISQETLQMIPLFLKIRELDNYSMFYNEPEELKHKVVADFMDERLRKIENSEPVIELDFTQF